MRIAALVLFALVSAAQAAETPPSSQPAPDPDPNNPGRTGAVCMNLTKTQPDKAFEMAGKWLTLGGGEEAKLCQAFALIGLKEYGEGARRLEVIAQESNQFAAARASMLAQAAQAWQLQGELGRAYAAQSSALIIVPQGSPHHVELLIDRAITLAEGAKFKEAIADLSQALAHDPQNSTAYALRASAKRLEGDEEEALQDAEAAVSIDPTNVNALLERGNLYRITKQVPQARLDWLRILELEPESAAADAARANIARVDVDMGKR